MALRKLSFRLSAGLPARRLDQALTELLGSSEEFRQTGLTLSKGKVRKLIVAGAVYLNGGRVRIASKACRPGARVEVYLDPAKLETGAERSARAGGATGGSSGDWKFEESAILFEDSWIVVVNKPAGLPTQPTLDEARANLYVALQKFMRARDGANAYVGLHHRLDRDTSGVMVFTKKKEANADIGRAFAEHLARKTYLAIVQASRPLPAEWRVENYLARQKGKAGRMEAVRSGGDRAVTEFRTLEQASGFALIEARPETGRMHQIRVHLAGSGAPIVGDRTYGGIPKIPGNSTDLRVMLHAAALTFPHPITKLEISFTAPPPPDFKQCLSHVFGSEPRS